MYVYINLWTILKFSEDAITTSTMRNDTFLYIHNICQSILKFAQTSGQTGFKSISWSMFCDITHTQTLERNIGIERGIERD